MSQHAFRHSRPAPPRPAARGRRTAPARFVAARRPLGSAYLMVLSSTLLVGAFGLGALLLLRAQMRTAVLTENTSQSRLTALSSIELTKFWIASNADWRKKRTVGVWTDKQPTFSGGTITVEADDPIDGNLGNRPHDPLILRATATRNVVQQRIEMRLNAQPYPLPALRYALLVAGRLHVTSGCTLSVGNAVVATNGSLLNQGAIGGSVEAQSVSSAGTVSGSLLVGTGKKAMPASSVPDMYAGLGTQIAAGSQIERRVLSPASNPWGPKNPEGVYVIRSGQDILLRHLRVVGTLVIITPGNTVYIDRRVLMEPARTDYPTLIVVGNVVFGYQSGSQKLSEIELGYNFNPTGTPYEGTADADTADEYPSEIRGLVHVTGEVDLVSSGLIRGALLCESNDPNSAIECESDFEIIYNPNLMTNPPQGYTQRVDMVPQSGSWRRLVE